MNEFRELHILVVGDLMLDKYVEGTVERISPEAPCPVFSKKDEKKQLGGAANVAAQLRKLGAKVVLAGCVANDEAGRTIIGIAKESNIATELVTVEKTVTTIKSRYIANTHQQVLRIDEETVECASDTFNRRVSLYITEHKSDLDIVVLSDYEKGVLSLESTQNIIKLCNRLEIPVIVDIKSADINKYSGATIIKGNEKEFLQMFASRYSDISLENIQDMRSRLGTNLLVVTLGKRGLIGSDVEGNCYCSGTSERNVYDVTGAGDVVTAYIAYLFSQGYRFRETLELANRAAGVKVERLGNSPVALEDVLCDKRRSVEQILALSQNKRVVFTNGCFDIIHSGHIKLLKKSAELGDVLVVGLNSDDSVKRLKGVHRPVNSLEDRIKVLSAISYIDYIVVFNENTPIDIITRLNPQVLVKGGDYSIDKIVGAEHVKSYGGNVCIIPLKENISTTAIIDKTKSF